MKTPKDLKYTKTDEWIKVEGDQATIGITDFAQDQLSDIVYVELLAEADDSIAKGAGIATIESVKAAADVNTPASGTVIAINEDLEDSPELLNSDPFEAGWIIKITLDDPEGLSGLMTAEEYEAYNEEREG